MSRASSRPAITSIGKPSVSRASRRNCRRVLGDAQRIRPDRADGVAGQAAQPLAEPRERFEGSRLARAIEPLVGGEACAELGLLAQRVERVHLAVHDAPDEEMEAVGAEVDRGEGIVARHSQGR